MGTLSKKARWGFLLFQGAAFAVAVGFALSRVRLSPGGLSSVHAGEPPLAGADGCARCHGEDRHASSSASCATCHGDVQAQIRGKKGLHGTLAPELAEDCGRCHQEHKGGEFPPVNRQSFALAGIPDASAYAHDGLSFFLTGKHLGLDCERCHRQAGARVLPKGEKRFLGLDQTCTRCHKDVHEGAFGPDCQSCHGQERPFPTVELFRHPDAFPLAGGHAGLACAKCHELGTLRSASGAPLAVRACVACHRSPHAEAFLVRAGGPAKPATCGDCHDPEKGSFLGPRATVTPPQHAALGFPLEAPHQGLACAACHADYGKARAGDLRDTYHRRYPGRSRDDCRVCHGDPHRGEFEIGAFKGRDCLSCHTRTAFAPPDFDMSKHDLVFRLEGRHRQLQCGQCHTKPGAAGPRDYRGVPVDCRSCHQDPHGGQFNQPLYLGGDCRICHTQSSWKPPTFSVDMHARTKFPLTGAHLGTSCTKCHGASLPGKAAAPGPRKFAGISDACASCHADVHDGKFDVPGRPETAGGQKSCARCHGTDSFRAVPARTFDHALWTGYPLRGAHAVLECASCHGRGAVPDGRGRTLGKAAGTSCQSCHADPHAGQFGPTASVNCSQCHREEGTFRNLLFDHQKDSRFKLDDLHSKLACAACHKPMKVTETLKAIRYKPLGTKCGDCHDPRGSR